MRWALFVKDVRSQTLVLIGAFLLMIAPVVIWAAVELPQNRYPQDIAVRETRIEVAMMIVIGVLVSSLTLSAYAGVAAARERRERSGDFLESLPVRRTSIVLSRVLAGACVALSVPIAGLAAAWLIHPGSLLSDANGAQREITREFALVINLYVVAPLLMAAIAWFAGSLLKSETIAAVLGIGGMAAISFAIWQVIERVNRSTPLTEESWMSTVGVTFWVCTIGFGIAGTAIALRRRSP